MIKKYHHYEVWEDYMHGMYKKLFGKERNIMLNKAITFTGNAQLYGEWMLKVVDQWPNSCEQNLTDIHVNQQAWIGHAACCMALECPEDLTRIAWGCLSKQQQDEANAKADNAIRIWNERQNNSVYSKVGKKGLQTGDSRRSASGTGSYVQSSLLPDDMQSDTKK
jgi:hypothetical protein